MFLFSILLVIHVLIAVMLILVILAQSSKGGLDSALGGAAQNVLGGSGGSAVLKRWTQIIGTAFFISCIVLALTVKHANLSGGAPKGSKLFRQLKQTTKPAPTPSAPVKK